MPLAGLVASDRAKAHYKWAQRYNERDERGKAASHFGRAMHYAAKETRFGASVKCPNKMCTRGYELPPYHDQDAAPTMCRVCGGTGSIPEATYAAWTQDPVFKRSFEGSTPQNYTDFYTNQYTRYKSSEVLGGRMPTLTLAEYIADRRSSQSAPPLDETLMPAGARVPVSDYLMKCPDDCLNGKKIDYYDQAITWTCPTCNGAGNMMASAIVASKIAEAARRAPGAATREAPRAVASTQPKWACSACTFENEASATRCAVCETVRQQVQASTASTVGTAGDSEESRKRQKSEQNECLVCFSPIDRLAALVPCGHARFCLKCAEKLSICPLCRKRIQSTLPIYTNFGRTRYTLRTGGIGATRLGARPE